MPDPTQEHPLLKSFQERMAQAINTPELKDVYRLTLKLLVLDVLEQTYAPIRDGVHDSSMPTTYRMAGETDFYERANKVVAKMFEDTQQTAQKLVKETI